MAPVRRGDLCRAEERRRRVRAQPRAIAGNQDPPPAVRPVADRARSMPGFLGDRRRGRRSQAAHPAPPPAVLARRGGCAASCRQRQGPGRRAGGRALAGLCLHSARVRARSPSAPARSGIVDTSDPAAPLTILPDIRCDRDPAVPERGRGSAALQRPDGRQSGGDRRVTGRPAARSWRPASRRRRWTPTRSRTRSSSTSARTPASTRRSPRACCMRSSAYGQFREGHEAIPT